MWIDSDFSVWPDFFILFKKSEESNLNFLSKNI